MYSVSGFFLLSYLLPEFLCRSGDPNEVRLAGHPPAVTVVNLSAVLTRVSIRITHSFTLFLGKCPILTDLILW